MTTEQNRRQAKANTYLATLSGVARGYGEALLANMTPRSIVPWPSRPQGLGQSRAQRIVSDLGDILKYWE